MRVMFCNPPAFTDATRGPLASEKQSGIAPEGREVSIRAARRLHNFVGNVGKSLDRSHTWCVRGSSSRACFHGSELALALMDDAPEAAKSDDAVTRGGQPRTLVPDVLVVEVTRCK
jgi:hypothetical protein